MATTYDNRDLSERERYLEMRVEALTQRNKELEALVSQLRIELALRRAEDAAMKKLLADCIHEIERPL